MVSSSVIVELCGMPFLFSGDFSGDENMPSIGSKSFSSRIPVSFSMAPVLLCIVSKEPPPQNPLKLRCLLYQVSTHLPTFPTFEKSPSFFFTRGVLEDAMRTIVEAQWGRWRQRTEPSVYSSE